ncbi:MAG TPA: hypothetical protein VF901_02020 [Bradyrhizobium sp.]
MTELDEELGPLLLAPLEYLELRRRLRNALGFPTERRPLLIGIDGLDGSGKSSLAAWLSWQLEMPAVSLDLFIVPDSSPLAFQTEHLAAVVNARSTTERPLIVEGVLLLDALDAIGRRPDMLIFVERDGNGSTMPQHVAPYIERQQPRARASHVLTWSSAEHDRRVTLAHLRSRTD